MQSSLLRESFCRGFPQKSKSKRIKSTERQIQHVTKIVSYVLLHYAKTTDDVAMGKFLLKINAIKSKYA